MKRTVVIVAAVAAVGVGAAAGASAYAGRAVTTRLSEQTAVVGKLLPELRVEEKVERGLFESARAITLQLGCVPVRAADGKSVERTSPIEVRWRDTIHHVPFVSTSGRGVARIDSELRISGAGIDQVFGNRAPLAVRTDVDFDGRFDSEVTLASFKLAPKPGDALEFDGFVMRLKGTFPEGGGPFTYSGHSQPLRVRAKAEEGELTATVGRMELSGSALIDPASPTFLLPYQNETRVSDVSVRFAAAGRDGHTPTSIDFALRRVVGTAESKIANDLWSNSNRVRGSLEAPGFAIELFEMGSALRNIHAPTFAKLSQVLIGRGLSCNPAQALDRPLEDMQALASTAFELLPYDPEYQVGPIAIELGGKRAELSYLVGVHGLARGAEPPPLMELMMKNVFARAEAKMHLGLIDALAAWGDKLGNASGVAAKNAPAADQAKPGAAAMMARMMVDGFVEQGFLVRDAETVSGRIEVDAGNVKLNGKPFDLPDFGALGGPDLNVVKGLIADGDPDGSAEP